MNDKSKNSIHEEEKKAYFSFLQIEIIIIQEGDSVLNDILQY